jgi:hypothetical protein
MGWFPVKNPIRFIQAEEDINKNVDHAGARATPVGHSA